MRMLKEMILSILFLFYVSLVWADFDKGAAAYEENDYATAYRELQSSATKGHLKAQFILGYMYHQGEGVSRDLAEAIKWYRLSAEQGDSDAQLGLGYMYHQGEGVSQDMAEAIKWYRLSAEQGDSGAQFNLGYMYSEGEGVSQDMAEAIKWYRLSAEQGDSDARSNLEMIRKETAYLSEYQKSVLQRDNFVQRKLSFAKKNTTLLNRVYKRTSNYGRTLVDWSKAKYNQVKSLDVCDGDLDLAGGVAIGVATTSVVAGDSVLVIVGSAGALVVYAPAIATGVTLTAIAGATVYGTAKGYCYLREKMPPKA